MLVRWRSILQFRFVVHPIHNFSNDGLIFGSLCHERVSRAGTAGPTERFSVFAPAFGGFEQEKAHESTRMAA